MICRMTSSKVPIYIGLIYVSHEWGGVNEFEAPVTWKLFINILNIL
jgi:hypothetical protein